MGGAAQPLYYSGDEHGTDEEGQNTPVPDPSRPSEIKYDWIRTPEEVKANNAAEKEAADRRERGWHAFIGQDLEAWERAELKSMIGAYELEYGENWKRCIDPPKHGIEAEWH